MNWSPLLWQSSLYELYRFDPARSDAALLPEDGSYCLQKHVSYSEMPGDVRRAIFAMRWLDVMFYRLLRGRAELYVVRDEHLTIAGYGWVQSGAVFARQFGFLPASAAILGFFHVLPRFRGRSIYPWLIGQCASMSSFPGEKFIFARSDNLQSIRGIQKAGCQWVRAFAMTRFLLFFKSVRSL